MSDYQKGCLDGFYNDYNSKDRWGFELSEYNKGYNEGQDLRLKMLEINPYYFI